MNFFSILLVMLHVLRVKTTIYEVFDDAEEVERKYLELIEVTAKIINQNVIESSSNYVASIGVNNEQYVSDRVLKKISATLASPSEVHGLAKNTIIFARNSNEISIDKNLDQIHRRGRFVICVTGLYSKADEFLDQFTKVASKLWISRVSRMIFVAWIGEELNIFGIQPYDERTCFPTELIEIGRAKNGRIFMKRQFFETIKNLSKCSLRISTTSAIPYVEIFMENNVKRLKGIEGNLLEILAKRMNFTPLIFDAEKLPGFDSTLNDIKDTLKFNKSDLCFAGKKVNINRIEPTVSIMDCKKIWIVPKAQRITPWMQEIIPFEKSVWISLVFTLFFTGLICLLLGNKISSLMNMWSLFLGVSIDMKKTPKNHLVRIVLGSWIFFSYVITRSYLASLGGYLTKPTYLLEMNTIQDLVASGIPIEGHRIVEKLFCSLNDTAVSRDVCTRFEKKSIETIFADIKSNGKLVSAFTMKAEIFKNSNFLRDYETHAMKEVLLRYPTAFLAQTGAPFLDEMNIIITRLIEAGFINLWQRESILMKHKKKHYPEKLRVQHVLGIIFIATLGYAISIIVFCIEYSIIYIDLARIKNKNKLSTFYKNDPETRNVS